MLRSAPNEVVLLIVDDEVIVRNMIQRALQLEGFSTLVAADGFEALEVSRCCKKLDLVITDIEMPGIDGLALSELLRQQRPGLQIVFISGKLPDGAAVPAPFLAKPFHPQDLIGLIRRILAISGFRQASSGTDASKKAD